MAHDEETLTAHYLDLLSRTGVEWRWLRPQFDPSHDGNAHVEFNKDGSWSLVSTDRGRETERERYADFHALMFPLCATATWHAALHQIRQPNVHVDELNRRRQAKQVELLRKIDPEWAETMSRRYARLNAANERKARAEAFRERHRTLIDIALYAGAAALVAGVLAHAWWFG